MVYANIEKRRAAYRRWAAKNKEKRAAYQRILYTAKKSNLTPETCSIDGCSEVGERHHPDYSEPAKIEWICRKHHRPLRHAGVCPLCGGKIKSRGLCNKHYIQERKKTDKEYAERRRIASRRKNPRPSRTGAL